MNTQEIHGYQAKKDRRDWGMAVLPTLAAFANYTNPVMLSIGILGAGTAAFRTLDRHLTYNEDVVKWETRRGDRSDIALAAGIITAAAILFPEFTVPIAIVAGVGVIAKTAARHIISHFNTQSVHEREHKGVGEVVKLVGAHGRLRDVEQFMQQRVGSK